MAAVDPSCFFEVRTVTSDVDESTGEAVIYVEIVVEGFGMKEAKFHTMSELKWKPDSIGFWWYYHYQGMIGMSGNDGFV